MDVLTLVVPEKGYAKTGDKEEGQALLSQHFKCIFQKRLILSYADLFLLIVMPGRSITRVCDW